ncbi:GDSL-type esterase/lipase family protein [Dysgonomonas sp. 520]|uniref:GDSL-type esterase/lipase family protein n=1 Tax=Dysgonomonas sp. 520 TaxID=2302931 RepID=UPI0013D1FA7A|nr:GDSL-type esterase/lipase family protein [Dysgonomonas sp. 520]NDW08722.1 hypothetical protein [Dysgonomonas sp. 520]
MKTTIRFLFLIFIGFLILSNHLNAQDNPVQRQKWETKIQRYERLDSITPPQKDVILFVGSSSIENWKSIESDFPDKPIVSRGVSGTKTVDIYEYRDRLISPYQAKQIFIYVGDNDIGYNWKPEEILEQFKKLFFAIRAEKPETEIVFISIKPFPKRAHRLGSTIETNKLIKDFLEQEENTAYADVYNAMINERGELNPEHYQKDGRHLTTDGYKIWREIILKFIK